MILNIVMLDIQNKIEVCGVPKLYHTALGLASENVFVSGLLRSRNTVHLVSQHVL